MLFYARLNQAKESPNNEADKLLGKLLKENMKIEVMTQILQSTRMTLLSM